MIKDNEYFALANQAIGPDQPCLKQNYDSKGIMATPKLYVIQCSYANHVYATAFLELSNWGFALATYCDYV
jgi:hypothetical protein